MELNYIIRYDNMGYGKIGQAYSGGESFEKR